MGLKGKMIAEVEVKSSGHHLHDHYYTKPHNLPNVSPEHIQGFQLEEGETVKPGSIVSWNYTLGGKVYVAKASVESVDEVNKTICFKFTEGHPLDDYKVFVFHIHTTDTKAKWIVEYEKRNENGPHPTDYLNLALNITDDVDDHHHKLQIHNI